MLPEIALQGFVLTDLLNAAILDASGAPVKVRYSRNRYANEEELPCISIMFDSVEPDEANTLYTMQERVWRLNLSLIIDADLATEESEEDPTGLANLFAISGAAVKAVMADDSETMKRANDVLDMGAGFDEDSNDDRARLVHTINVLYRTPYNDRTVLLTEN